MERSDNWFVDNIVCEIAHKEPETKPGMQFSVCSGWNNRSGLLL